MITHDACRVEEEKSFAYANFKTFLQTVNAGLPGNSSLHAFI